jgi:hypothetical protein
LIICQQVSIYFLSSPNGRFALSLWLVSSRGYDEVAAWLEHGKRTGDYPGLGQIKDGVKLHSITLRLES